MPHILKGCVYLSIMTRFHIYCTSFIASKTEKVGKIPLKIKKTLLKVVKCVPVLCDTCNQILKCFESI